MRPYWWSWEWGAPVEGHYIRLEFRTKGSVGGRRPEALHRGERAAKCCSCWVDRGGRAHQAKGSHPPLVRGRNGDGGKAGLCGQYGGGRSPEAVGRPSLDLAQVDLPFREHA